MSNPPAFATFAPGQIIETRSAGDRECIFRIEVVSRTARMLTFRQYGEIKRCKIHADEEGEWCNAMGVYSMCPAFHAKNAGRGLAAEAQGAPAPFSFASLFGKGQEPKPSDDAGAAPFSFGSQEIESMAEAADAEASEQGGKLIPFPSSPYRHFISSGETVIRTPNGSRYSFGAVGPEALQVMRDEMERKFQERAARHARHMAALDAVISGASVSTPEALRH